MDANLRQCSQIKCSDQYGSEVLKLLVQMRSELGKINKEITVSETEKRKLHQCIRQKTERLHKAKQAYCIKSQFKVQLAKTIKETEQAYSRLVECSQSIYNNVKEKRYYLGSNSAHNSAAFVSSTPVTSQEQLDRTASIHASIMNAASVAASAVAVGPGNEEPIDEQEMPPGFDPELVNAELENTDFNADLPDE